MFPCLSSKFSFNISNPYISAANFDAIAALWGSFSSTNSLAAPAVSSFASAFKPKESIWLWHCANAWGWEATYFKSSILTPGSARRQCTIGSKCSAMTCSDILGMSL